ncbi:MAG: WecB/TagA/CpsF family glycosyltransferase [Caldilineales bacterium]
MNAPVEILGVRVDPVTYDEVIDIMSRWIDEGGPHQIATVNPEFVMAARGDARFRQTLNSANLCVADGAGLLWAARLLGQSLPERVTGSDLVPRVAREAAARGWRVYLLGAAAGVADATARILTAQNPDLRIAGSFSGSPSALDAPAIVAWVRHARPDILFVAYGAPAQDLWIAEHGPALGVPVMMGVGGAFDHIAGVQRRAGMDTAAATGVALPAGDAAVALAQAACPAEVCAGGAAGARSRQPLTRI